MRFLKVLQRSVKNDPSYFFALVITLSLVLILLHNANRSFPAGEILDQNNQLMKKENNIKGIPDFSAYTNTTEKKQVFFDYLRPFIRQENQKIQYDRELLESLKVALSNDPEHKTTTIRKLKKLAEKYHLKLNNIKKTIAKLELRIGIIPESLVLVQAANESGWGTSRFAKEGNNYFGQWCYSEGCGIVPNSRVDEAQHEVKVFASPRDSVISYMKNLNTYYAYHDLRKIRQDLIKSGLPVKGTALAVGLSSYSERRGEYVDDIISMIAHNNLE